MCSCVFLVMVHVMCAICGMMEVRYAFRGFFGFGFGKRRVEFAGCDDEDEDKRRAHEEAVL
jgi:hypothetical protein